MANVRDISEKKDSPTNPYGANQYTMDPRQLACWQYYIDPKSETFGNATQSAIKAGYTDGTANQITTEAWFIGKLRRLQLLDKAEKVLEETLDLDTLDEDGKKDRGLHALKLDAAKFVAKTQGKNEGYSERQELTGKDGKDLPTPIAILSGLKLTEHDLPSDNSNEKDTGSQKENTSDTRRNVLIEDSFDSLISDS